MPLSTSEVLDFGDKNATWNYFHSIGEEIDFQSTKLNSIRYGQRTENGELSAIQFSYTSGDISPIFGAVDANNLTLKELAIDTSKDIRTIQVEVHNTSQILGMRLLTSRERVISEVKWDNRTDGQWISKDLSDR